LRHLAQRPCPFSKEDGERLINEEGRRRILYIKRVDPRPIRLFEARALSA